MKSSNSFHSKTSKRSLWHLVSHEVRSYASYLDIYDIRATYHSKYATLTGGEGCESSHKIGLFVLMFVYIIRHRKLEVSARYGELLLQLGIYSNSSQAFQIYRFSILENLFHDISLGLSPPPDIQLSSNFSFILLVHLLKDPL